MELSLAKLFLHRSCWSFPLVGALAPIIASFGRHDHMLLATCESASEAGYSVTIEDSDSLSLGTGKLNTAKFPVGAILRLPAGSHGTYSVVYVLRTSYDNFLPVQQQNLFVRATGSFRVHPDDDVLREAQRVRVDLAKMIDNNTMATVSIDAKRVALRNPLSLINRDEVAVHLVESGQGLERFGLVTAVSYGDPAMELLYTESALSIVNVTRVGRFNLHIEYRCNEAESLNSSGGSLGRETPLIFFYLPLKYSMNNKRVEF